jgi:hypothetical protein
LSHYSRGSDGAGFRLIHEVDCSACGDTNLTRTTIGIGEVVHLSGMPANTVWSVSGGGMLSSTNGSSVDFTAAMSPGSSTVTANNQSVSDSIEFTVVAPSGVSAVVKTNFGLGVLGTNQIGAYTQYWVSILPTNVSFVNVEMRENIPAVTNVWPNGETVIILAVTNGWGLANFCLEAVPDSIAEPLRPIGRIFNGTNFVDYAYTLSYGLEYKNGAGDWVRFADIETVTEFQASGVSRQNYQGVPGSWQGPWE